MQTIKAHDKAVVLVLNKKEAEALLKRVSQNTWIRVTKPLLAAQEKLITALKV